MKTERVEWEVQWCVAKQPLKLVFESVDQAERFAEQLRSIDKIIKRTIIEEVVE